MLILKHRGLLQPAWEGWDGGRGRRPRRRPGRGARSRRRSTRGRGGGGTPGGTQAACTGAHGPGTGSSLQSFAARERRRRISEKTAELSRLIPSGHKLNTAEMLQEAARHMKLLQAQVGMLAFLHTIEQEKVPPMAQEQMHALLVCDVVQERLAAEGKCLVLRKLVDTIARDSAVKTNTVVSRDLSRFIESLLQEQ